MANGNENPWVRVASVINRKDRPESPLNDHILPSVSSAGDVDDVVGDPTGPVGPQPHVAAPEDGLPVRCTDASALLWIVGAHGGSGESTLAGLAPSWRAAGHAWPEAVTGEPMACVVVARTSVRGLLAARTALTQWAASGAGVSVRLLGLVLVADAPGRLPAPIRDLAQVVGGGAPRSWRVPWVEAWRLGAPMVESVPRPVFKLASQWRSLAAEAVSSADPSQTEEKS